VTTREIADAVGKAERTVHNWVARVSERNAEVSEKVAQAKSSSVAADYSLDETIEIIETGMGRNAAEIYRQNAVHTGQNARSTPVHQSVDVLHVMSKMMEMMVVLTDKVASIQAPSRQLMLEAPIAHMSLMGFIRSRGEKSPDIETLKRIGAALSARCRERNLTITKIPDERYGTVNGYPMEALEEYFTL
jgi:transposase-like protein